MSWRYGRIALAVIGALLVAAGLIVAYWWFYRLGPARRVLDPEWFFSHSQQEFWREVQKGIRRGAWMHDDGFHVGHYGDKSWARWIMAHVEPGDEMHCFGKLCHSATAMQAITNQDAGENADDWLAWWEKNRARTQLKWIADGFRQHGVDVDAPPTPEQVEALLALLGKPESDEVEDDPEAVPDYLKYNAFRWLRDSGFQAVAYVVSNERPLAPQKLGLLEYARYEKHHSSACNVGILSFGAQEEDVLDVDLPAMMMPSFQIRVHAAIWIPLVLGTVLVVWSLRKSVKKTQTS